MVLQTFLGHDVDLLGPRDAGAVLALARWGAMGAQFQLGAGGPNMQLN